ncbi:phosphopantetheine-binding protein [Streptomyces sp. ACA25]|uniref:acyl carrier protein n=1 Tax=Streptomyces sp. ACA25 TaxID=3022596 RepID=UPI0023077F8A|nr:phosphopantetheine-binding protein [Streptomyces sp. ACA25]MDB1090211.1 phosphopantetheine-binding protein [Streptomyces sp. ACA25]
MNTSVQTLPDRRLAPTPLAPGPAGTADVATLLADISRFIRDIVPEAPEFITATDHLENDLGVDSLSLVEVLVNAETAWQNPIDDDQISEVTTVQHLLDLAVRTP